jgi:hypothetical protein
MKGAQKAENTRTGVDRPGSAGALLNGGMSGIFVKLSDSVRFCKPDPRAMRAISLPFAAKSAGGGVRTGRRRAPTLCAGGGKEGARQRYTHGKRSISNGFDRALGTLRLVRLFDN